MYNIDSYLSAQYTRLPARQGSNRAAVAVEHSIHPNHRLSPPEKSEAYYELGAGYFDKRAVFILTLYS